MYKLVLLATLLLAFHCQLIQVVTIFRHGSRFPLQSTYDGSQTKDGWGELSPTGMRQLYNLGAMMRKQYVTDLQYLKSSYNHSEIQVLCTIVNRTQMSVNSFLYGLYPQSTGPKLPATVKKSCLLPPYAGQTDDINETEYTLPRGRQIINMKQQDWGGIFVGCSKQQSKNRDDNHAAIEEMNTRYGPFFSNMSKLFGEKYPFILQNISSIFDTLVCDKFMNRPLPDAFSDNDYLNMRHLHYYINIINQGYVFAYAVNTPKFKYTFSNFDKAISNPKGEFKMGILSCHDGDIRPLQYQLNISNANCIQQLYRFNKTNALNCQPGPEFGSSVILQLHKNGTQYNVMVKFNGKYMYLCERKETSCPYSEFRARIERDYKNTKDVC